MDYERASMIKGVLFVAQIFLVSIFLFFFINVPLGYALKTNVYGWAWIGEDDGTAAQLPIYGWTSANCYNTGPGGFTDRCAHSKYGLLVNPDTGGGGTIEGYLWNLGIGWIDFSPFGPYPTFPQYSARFHYQDDDADPNDPYTGSDGVYEAGQVSGWARIVTLADYGRQAFGKNNWGWVQLRGAWAREDGGEETQGTWIDFDSGQIYGWAWSGGLDDGTPIEAQGIGWIQFRNLASKAIEFSPTFQAPFIEALRGNMYGQKGVGIDPDTSRQSFAPLPGNYNATYLIESGGDIRHFVSEERGKSSNITDPYTLPLDDPITFPQAGNRYTNLLGRLDVEGLRTDVGDQKNKNKYGHDLYAATSNKLSRIPNLQDLVLGNTIYVLTPKDGTFFADADPQWNNAPGAKSGAGLIIVDGDLQIDSDMNYKIPGRPMKSIGALASVAWIVLGDITIDPSVTDLAGAYIALGRDDGTGGTVSTGEANTQLGVKGLLMAKQFNFQRTYIGTFDAPQSSEKVIYDGRLHVNVPPGLEDFSAGFPIQRATLP